MQPDDTSLISEGDNRRRLGSLVIAVFGTGYGIFLAGFVGMSRIFGERCWPISPFLYLPAQTWLLPLVILVPGALVFNRRLLPVFAGCFLLVVVCFAGFRFGLGSRGPRGGAPFVTVLTNNIGESHRQSMAAFVQNQDPDLMVLEDARGRSSWYRRAYPGRSVAGVGEFVIISRFPISNARLLVEPGGQIPVAAAFRVEWPGRSFTLYAVHLPTPRRDFYRLRGRGFLAELLRGRSGGRVSEYAEAMRKRGLMAQWLAGVISAEKDPVLAAGDFNAPSWGYVHSLFDASLTDAFDAAGRGFGFTFPGDTRNPLTLFGPWLRLDYLFCNRGWVALSCCVEPGRRSQHRCVAARFEWLGNRH